MTKLIDKLKEIQSRIERLKYKDFADLEDIENRLEELIKKASLGNSYIEKLKKIQYINIYNSSEGEGASENYWNSGKEKLKNLTTLILEEISESEPLEKISKEFYVDLSRIEEIKAIKSESLDYKKLVAFLEALNISYKHKTLICIPLLIRAIIDHIPPVFGKSNFADVCGSHGSKSFKEAMNKLNEINRKIADMYLHTHIRAKESLPNETQVDVKQALDLLLAEIVRVQDK